ncbi:hypothetical protein [Sphingobium yanoikuyae]|uniref:hypothetical protein n=1 Tax=Sphingobium yanoikuyae TaxID=13690 RepID=UPI0028ADDDD8|nr:hypothetical protein [Sphingobium yanoikuyae]
MPNHEKINQINYKIFISILSNNSYLNIIIKQKKFRIRPKIFNKQAEICRTNPQGSAVKIEAMWWDSFDQPAIASMLPNLTSTALQALSTLEIEARERPTFHPLGRRGIKRKACSEGNAPATTGRHFRQFFQEVPIEGLVPLT